MSKKDNILSDAAEQSKDLEDMMQDAYDTEETVGNTEETVGNTEETVGNTEETVGNTEETVGNTEETVEEAEIGEVETPDEGPDIIDNPELLGNSEVDKPKKEKMSKKTKIIAGCCAVGLLAVIGIVAVVIGRKPTNEKVLEAPKGFELSTDSASKLDKVELAVDTLYKDNAYITVHTGEESTRDIYMMYNKDKECYIESGYSQSLVVMRNDYKAVTLTNPVGIGEDIGILSSIERAVELGRTGYAEIESEATENSDGEPKTTYYITVTGKHNIRKMYTVVSNEYADKMMTSIFEDKYDAKLYQDPNYIDKNDNDSLEIQVVLGDDGGKAAQCNLSIEGFKYINWWFDGYMKLEDYKLDEKWYSEDNDTTAWATLAAKLQSTLSTNISSYIDENLTDEEIGAIEEDNKTAEGNNEDANTNANGLFVKEYTRPTGDLTADEKKYWDQMDSITKKILNDEEISDEEKSLYYALPASNSEE